MQRDDTHDVDVIAGVDGSGEDLVRVTTQLVGTVRASELCADALLRHRTEAPRGDLLTLEDGLGHDQA